MARSHSHNPVVRLSLWSFLCVMVAAATVWCAPRASGAVAGWMATPAVDLRTARLAEPLSVGSEVTGVAGDGGLSAGRSQTDTGILTEASPTLDPGAWFTMIGVTCSPPTRTGGVKVLIRTSEDRRVWTRWFAVDLERAAEPGQAERAFTEPVWTGRARFVQIAARRAGGARSAPARLQQVRVVAIDTEEDADRAATAVGVLRRVAAAVAGFRLTSDAAGMTTRPTIVTRAEWGANESWRSGPPSYADVKMAFVHHTAGGNRYTADEAPGVVRGIYAYHTKSLHWSDIGYNFLIDRYGRIYEGRHGGMTRGVVGAQVLGFNTGSTGVSLMGTFASTTPPSAAVRALDKLLAWKLDVHHVDPLGSGTLVCGYGQKFATGESVTFAAIAGHCHANFTACPGDRLYRLLPDIRKVVAQTGLPKIYGPSLSSEAISPDGDGLHDSTTIGFDLSESASWRLRIRDEGGRPVCDESGEGTAAEVKWDGRDESGGSLPDGAYAVRVDATCATGSARSASATVFVDTRAPGILSASVDPRSFSPNGDGQNDVAKLSFQGDEPAAARVTVLGGDGSALRKLVGWKDVSADVQRLSWNGWVSTASGTGPAPEGRATILVELRDEAGNTSSARRAVTVDRTLKLVSVSRRTFSPNGDGVHDAVTMSFRLKRTARVTASITRAGEDGTLRALYLGKLGSGARAFAWDGRLGDGAAPVSGRYVLRLSATGAIGVSTVGRKVTVDLVAPRLKAPAKVLLRRGKTAKFTYVVRDPFSSTVKVSATIGTARGGAIATLALGWVKQAVNRSCSWRPPRRGTYVITFRARDRGGNHEAAPARTLLIVR